MNTTKSLIAVGVVLCLLLSSLSPLMLPGNARAQPADSPWPMFGQNPQRTGQSPYTGPDMPYLKWRLTTGDGVFSSPVIGTHGTAWTSDDSCAKPAPAIIGPPDGILFPANTDPDLCGNEPFTISWYHQCDSCKYDIQVALDEDFTELVEASRLHYEPPDEANPSYLVEGGALRCATTYYWRLRSVEVENDEEIRSCWSPSRTFTVAPQTDYGVNLISPMPGATNIPRTNIAFTWTSYADADSYSFVLSPNADFSDPVDSRTGLTATGYTFAGTLAYDTAYYWKVTAVKDGVPISWAVSVFRTVAAPLPPPRVDVEVGVKAGDWIKSEYEITGWPAGQPYPEWLKLEFLTVEGASADVRVTMRMSDGTEETDTMPLHIGSGAEAPGLSGGVIPANLTTGDSVYMTGYGWLTLEGETTRNYAGANRTVVYAGFSQYGVELTYYWDKLTGVMVEASTTHGDMTATAKATETNMWERAPTSIRCFIATAAYGTPMAEEIEILREFRDGYLLTNRPGRAFVDFYYRVSPPIAGFVTEHPTLKPLVRAGLGPAIALTTVVVNTTPAETMTIVGVLVLVALAIAVRATKWRGRGRQYA
ncbi:MAG: hypothetical protein IBX67_04210 [Dehalococcoidia bacterium]|nr:hypothetical protein [Dehalococcoidia bacterium]